MLVFIFTSLLVLTSAVTDEDRNGIYRNTNEDVSSTTIRDAAEDKVDEGITTEYPQVNIFMSSTIKGNVYTVQVHLPGYDEDEIKVQAKQEILVIEYPVADSYAIKNFAKMFVPLPNNVNAHGTWIYENSKLTIMFPFNEPMDVSKSKDNQSTDTVEENGEKHKVIEYYEESKEVLQKSFPEWTRNNEAMLTDF